MKQTTQQNKFIEFMETPLTPILLRIIHYVTFVVVTLAIIGSIVTGLFSGQLLVAVGGTTVSLIVYLLVRIWTEICLVLFNIERNTRR